MTRGKTSKRKRAAKQKAAAETEAATEAQTASDLEPASASAPASASDLEIASAPTIGAAGAPKAARTAARRPALPAVPAFDLDVVVAEAAASHSKRAVEVLTALGCRARAEAELGGVTRTGGPDVVLVGLPEQATAAMQLALKARRPVIVAALGGPADTAPQRAAAVGADLFVLRPHSAESLAPALHAARRLAVDGKALAAARAGESAARERLQRYGGTDAATGFRHFDFFKEVLVMELKRAKRYGYSLAAGVVAFDPWPGEIPPAPVVRRLRGRVAVAIASHIRDIDLPVDLAADRMLVFLPYTDLAGAELVGKRIAAAVRESGEVVEDGERYTVTVSIGMAAQRIGQPVSFARLMRDANTALRAAMLKGGGRVVVRSAAPREPAP